MGQAEHLDWKRRTAGDGTHFWRCHPGESLVCDVSADGGVWGFELWAFIYGERQVPACASDPAWTLDSAKAAAEEAIGRALADLSWKPSPPADWGEG